MESKIPAHISAPNGVWLAQFLLRTNEGKALAILSAAPLAFGAWALCSCFSFTTVLLITAVSVVGSYVIARGGKVSTKVDLSGKTAIVTGGNTGIGLESVRSLAQSGARVVLACRDTKKGEAARESITKSLTGSGSVEVRELDLSSTASIRAFVQAWGQADLHILMNNAGVMFPPYSKTADGFEVQIGTNHLGHMLLTVLLLPVIKRCAARVVTVSSIGHALYPILPKKQTWAEALSPSADKYNRELQYGNSKLANILFTRSLEAKLAGSGAHAYCCHPGVVRTELGRHAPEIQKLNDTLGSILFKSPSEGAQTQLYLATDPNAKPVLFHADCVPVESAPVSYSDEAAAELWAESCKLLKIEV